MKTYACTCPVCLKAHDVQAGFMSSPTTLIANNGRPGLGHSCGAHTGAELRAAYAKRNTR